MRRSREASRVLNSKVDELKEADYRKPAHDPELSAGDAEQRRVLKLILYDALASEAMGTLTTGVFLVGFAVALGAGNFAIGMLAAVPFCVQLLQIPAVLLVERWRARRDICVCSTAVGRAFLLGAAAAPLLGRLFAVVSADRLAGDLSSHGSDRRLRLEFMDARSRPVLAIRSIFRAADHGDDRSFGDMWRSLVASWSTAGRGTCRQHTVFGYSILFMISALIGFIGVYLLRITPDRPMAAAEKAMHPLALLVAPFREANFRRLIIFLSSWNFAANSRGAVLHRLYVEIARLFDDHCSCFHHRKSAEQSCSARAMGRADRPLQQQGRARNCGAALSRLHFCLDFHRAAMGTTDDALPPGDHPHPDGYRHRGRRIGVGQHRHETLAGRPSDSLSCR